MTHGATVTNRTRYCAVTVRCLNTLRTKADNCARIARDETQPSQEREAVKKKAVAIRPTSGSANVCDAGAASRRDTVDVAYRRRNAASQPWAWPPAVAAYVARSAVAVGRRTCAPNWQRALKIYMQRVGRFGGCVSG